MKDKLIANGVRNLREFGYPDCNEKNILTDYIFASFFLRMLPENKGYSTEIDAAIDELIVICQKTVAKGCGKPKAKKPKKVVKKNQTEGWVKVLRTKK